jgi:hypothetical protein
MPWEKLDVRLQMLVELALNADCACDKARSRQDARARKLGLVGAEVDAARARKSFDVRTAAAIDMACALAFADNERIRAAEQQALEVGFNPHELRRLRKLANSAHSCQRSKGR